jgi:hypothetical protein
MALWRGAREPDVIVHENANSSLAPLSGYADVGALAELPPGEPELTKRPGASAQRLP